MIFILNGQLSLRGVATEGGFTWCEHQLEYAGAIQLDEWNSGEM